MQKIIGLLTKYEKESVIAGLSLASGIVLTILYPWLAKLTRGLFRVIARVLGGRVRQREFLRSYCEWLVIRHKEFRFVGLQLTQRRPQLDDVFVPLRLESQDPSTSASSSRPSAPQHSAARRFLARQIMKLIKTGAYLAWNEIRLTRSGLKFSGFNDTAWNFTVRTANNLVGIRRPASPAEEVIADVKSLGKHAAILGPGGSGKTALLQYLVLVHARRFIGKRSERRVAERLALSRQPLVPIYISLADLAKYMDKRAKRRSLVDYIEDSLPADLRKWLPVDFFLPYLQAGRCLVLLDGLDEVFNETDYRRVRELIQGFLARYSKNRVVLTCRPTGWREGVGSDFSIAKIQELNSNQISVFVRGWMRFRYPKENRRAEAMADDLIGQLLNEERLTRLASTPLLLTLIVNVFDSTQHALPLERALLYRKCVEVLLERDESKGLSTDRTGIRPQQKAAMVQHLAWAMHSGTVGHHGGGHGAPRSDVEEFLRHQMHSAGLPHEAAAALVDFLINRTGLLIHTDIDIVAFSHLSFQEYLAAEHIRATESVRQFLSAREKGLGHWQGVFLVLAGLVPDASSLLRTAYRRNNDDPFLNHLNLACSVMAEAISVSDSSLVHDVLEECLQVYVSPAAKLPITIPLPLRDFLTEVFTRPSWQYITVSHYIQRGNDQRRNVLGKLPNLPVSEKIATLDALAETSLTDQELRVIAGLLSDVNTAVLRNVARILDNPRFQPSDLNVNVLMEQVARLIVKEGDDALPLVPLVLKWKPTGVKLIDALHTGIERTVSNNLNASFLLGYLTDDGIVAYEETCGKIQDEMFFVERACSAAGAMAAGSIDADQIARFVRMIADKPRSFRALSSFALRLAIFGNPATSSAALRGHLDRRLASSDAVITLQELPADAIDHVTADRLLALVKQGCGHRWKRKRQVRMTWVKAAELLPRLASVTDEDLLWIAREGAPAIVQAVVRNLCKSRLVGKLGELREILNQRAAFDPLINTTEWEMVRFVSTSLGWADPAEEAPRLLESWLFDDRWYIQSEAAKGWRDHTERPKMSPTVVARMYQLMGYRPEEQAPDGVNASSPRLRALSALSLEAVLNNYEWPLPTFDGHSQIYVDSFH